MSSEESLSVRSISVDAETPETEQVMATVAEFAELAKLGAERSAAADGNGDCAPLSPPDVSLHSVPRGGGGDGSDGYTDDPEVSTDATPVEENNEGSDDRDAIPFESISKMSTTSSSGSEEEKEEEGRGEIRARWPYAERDGLWKSNLCSFG